MTLIIILSIISFILGIVLATIFLKASNRSLLEAKDKANEEAMKTIKEHYNDAVNEGNIAQSAEQKEFRKLKKAYLTSYDKAIESVRQADHCISCNQCSPHCPQHIRIPRELRRIDNYVEQLKQETL